MTSALDKMRSIANGRTRPRPRYLEDKLQKACICWFDCQWPQFRLLLHHSPNEGLLIKRGSDGAKRKAMGVRAGFPDLIFLLRNKDYAYLAIELKAGEGRQRESQKEYQKAVEKAGGKYVIIRTLEEFINTLNAYIVGV